MKKRAMKKWIPEGGYCDKCKWRRLIKVINHHRNTNCEFKHTCKEDCWTNPSNSCQTKVFKCEYMGYIDWTQESLLWDGCKECGVKDN